MAQFDVDATALRSAIGDGEVELHDLARATAALAVVGSDADMLELWETADDIAWNHVADVVDVAADDDKVLDAHARLALGSWRWSGDVPQRFRVAIDPPASWGRTGGASAPKRASLARHFYGRKMHK